MITYTTKFFGDEYTVTGDFSNASSPVLWCGEPTQYQVADFRHDSDEAMRRQLEMAVEASGDAVEDFAEDIEEAIANIQ